MSDRPSGADILNLSLDEYIRLYVHTDFKPKTSDGRASQQSQFQQRRRYEQSHFDGPKYRRQQRERLQKLTRKQQQQQRQLQQHQRLSESMSVRKNAYINKLRMEQKRLQQKSLEEMNALQERIRLQQQKAVEEIRELQLRHRQQHVALQKLIDEAQRKSVQCFLGDNIDRVQGRQKLHDVRSLVQEQDDQLRQEQQQPIVLDSTSTIVGNNYKALMKLATNLTTAAHLSNYNEVNNEKTMCLTALNKSLELRSDIIAGKSELIHKQELKFELANENTAKSLLSTENDDHPKQEIELDDDLDTDLLYIPTNFSLNE